MEFTSTDIIWSSTDPTPIWNLKKSKLLLSPSLVGDSNTSPCKIEFVRDSGTLSIRHVFTDETVGEPYDDSWQIYHNIIPKDYPEFTSTRHATNVATVTGTTSTKAVLHSSPLSSIGILSNIFLSGENTTAYKYRMASVFNEAGDFALQTEDLSIGSATAPQVSGEVNGDNFVILCAPVNPVTIISSPAIVK